METCRCSIFSIFKQLKFRRNDKYFHYYSLDSPDTRGCRGRLRGASTIAPRVSRGMETNESLMLVPSNFLHSYTLYTTVYGENVVTFSIHTVNSEYGHLLST